MMTNVANFKHQEFLVSVDWLLENLEDPNLRIYDCTAHLIPHPTETYTIGSGKGDYEKAHIPGADFLDLQQELSNNTSKLRFHFQALNTSQKLLGHTVLAMITRRFYTVPLHHNGQPGYGGC